MLRILIVISFFFIADPVLAQNNYEIQVYGSELVAPANTMLELHSNITLNGSKTVQDGVLPTQGAIHETVEITHGFTNWMEVGFYFFNSIGDQNRTNYVGSHVRPRFAVPESAKFPVGLSLSFEVGSQKREFSTDNWTLELRPIIDKTMGRWYFAINPTLDRSLSGLNSDKGFIFSPNAKVAYTLSDLVSTGLEYYGSTGPVFSPSPTSQQENQLFGVVDLNFSSQWEFNAGYGMSFNNVADGSIIKIIVGRRFGNKTE